MNNKYYWWEAADGGDMSEPFDSLEAAKEAAIERARTTRWTARELANRKKNWENIILVGYIDEHDQFIDLDSIEIDENILDRIY